ncbi:MAG: methylmalonyl-CoA epimerase [Chloroflexi bacterium]|nr:methylmalonyl-CoA epimerase [Chloroflexota bacterium]
MIKKLHHVAMAVDSVEDALQYYRDILGLTDITILKIKDRGLKVALIKAGVSEIELLEPTTEDNTVRRFIERRGPGLHHICFEVDDLEAAMKEYEGKGAEWIDPVPRPGAVGLVNFMPPSVAEGVLVEFAQTTAYYPKNEPPKLDGMTTAPVSEGGSTSAGASAATSGAALSEGSSGTAPASDSASGSATGTGGSQGGGQAGGPSVGGTA